MSPPSECREEIDPWHKLHRQEMHGELTEMLRVFSSADYSAYLLMSLTVSIVFNVIGELDAVIPMQTLSHCA